jgi:hypothetical protein
MPVQPNHQVRINNLYNTLVEIRRSIAEIVRRTPNNAHEFYLNYDQRFMIDLYMNMYNTTLRQIDFLYQDIQRPNIHTNVRVPRVNRTPNYNSTGSERPRNTQVPLSRDINTLLSDAMRNMGFPDLTPVRVIPTPEQVSTATRTIRFGDVVNPPNARCPIRLESFEPNTLVTQIIYCRHCFHSEECERWFEYSVRCPVCRHDIRTVQESYETGSQSQQNQEQNRSIPIHQNINIENEDEDEDGNENYEFDRWNSEQQSFPLTSGQPHNIANILTNTIGNIMANTNTREFTFDASNSMIIYDTIFRREH